MFGLLTKVVQAVVQTPIALAVDVVSLPSTAYDNKAPFTNTAAVLNKVLG